MRLSNGDIYQLKEIAKKKKLICFGSGKEFRDFFKDYERIHLEKSVYAVADNDPAKAGTTVSVAGSSIPVISVEQLLAADNMAVLISCADIEGVLRQLKQYRELEEVQCFAVYFVRSMTNRTDEAKRHYPGTFRITRTALIPKKIHYCWFGGNPIPEKNLAWMESWKRHCPDYEIIRWDESNYDISRNRYMQEAYQSKKWGFVSDCARIDIIYHEGGIYLDTDVELVKSLEDLRYQEAFMGVEASLKINLGLGFGSIPHFSLWKELLEMYEKTSFLNEDGTLNQTACPQLQHDVYVRNGFVCNGEWQTVGGASVYPVAVLSPKDLYTEETVMSPHAYSIHHYDASWFDRDMMLRNVSIRKLYKKFKEINKKD